LTTIKKTTKRENLTMHHVDKVVITTLVENYVDMLIPDTERVKRASLAAHFDPRTKNIRAENGIAFLVELFFGDYKSKVLFDAGLTSDTLLHNMSVLGISPNEIDHAVISHGHPDHCGGLLGLLQARDYPLPVVLHPDAFITRYCVFSSGIVVPTYSQEFRKSELEKAGGTLVLTRDPLQIAPATFTTGEIPFKVSFEPPGPPGWNPLKCIRDGKLEDDQTLDDIALAVSVKDKGIIVITGCAHAGIINSIRQAQAATGVKDVYAIFGGFHLGFPGVSAENVDQTLIELKSLEPSVVSPMHCSGFNTLATVAKEMPDQFLLNTAGARIFL
jgi:7,8-dihydropterin-6-yl-methyl-4-(beta-D-ribofuranosyl)aminobenzene 5'-phosphate synthase